MTTTYNAKAVSAAIKASRSLLTALAQGDAQ